MSITPVDRGIEVMIQGAADHVVPVLLFQRSAAEISDEMVRIPCRHKRPVIQGFYGEGTPPAAPRKDTFRRVYFRGKFLRVATGYMNSSGIHSREIGKWIARAVYRGIEK
mgnify:CR=1 FL=1